MLRRKNNEIPYVQPRVDQSPYRFQRKNTNISPGLSPLRCRTPTRNGNVSPFRGGILNDNLRAHSPIKFINNNRHNNPQTNGFFRTENNHTSNNYNKKYATCANNDHSVRIQSYHQFENNSKIKHQNDNAQRMAVHENTKLFSKLVSKINSQKKKQPQLTTKNLKYQGKKQIYDKQKFIQDARRDEPLKLMKQQSQPQNRQLSSKMELITQNIQQVQSVVYQKSKVYQKEESPFLRKLEIKQKNKTLQHLQNLVIKQNFQIQQKKNYNSKENQQIFKQFIVQQKNIQQQVKIPLQLTNQQQHFNHNQERMTSNVDKKSHSTKVYLGISQLQQLKEKQNSQNLFLKLPFKNVSQVSNEKVSSKKTNQDQKYFEDVKFYLDMLKQSNQFGNLLNKDDSLSYNKSDMSMSLMNMDPFI